MILMKISRLIILIFLISKSVFAQTPRQITNTELEAIKQGIEKEIIQLRKDLESKEYLNDFDKQITIEFKIDSYRIDKLLTKKLEIDYSTAGTVQATYESEIEYDKLLNKYYQLLYKKLKETDKDILKKSQINWLQFRDSERILNNAISKKEYSGGGTMQRIIVADKYLKITRERVNEIIDYLLRIYE